MNAENILKGGNAIEFPPFSWILLTLTLLLFPTSMYEFRFTHWIRYRAARYKLNFVLACNIFRMLRVA